MNSTRKMMISSYDSSAEEGSMLLVRKPKGWTSFDVVNKLRGGLRVRKIGHAGTLDPLATGLLIVCTGKKTKQIDQFMGLEKEYRCTMMLGSRTESFDSATPVVETRSTDDITEEQILAVMDEFVGCQTQLPPMWSAAKVNGRRLYKYARKGIAIKRTPREVFIRSMQAFDVSIPRVSFSVVCSKGTYVRTLVDDMGRRLGCGAHIVELERTRIGDFTLEDARTIDEFLHHSHEHLR